MTKYSMRPLTTESWILSADGEKIGIVSQSSKDKVSIIGQLDKKLFKSLESLKDYLGKNLTIEEPIIQKDDIEEGSINGFPIKHSIWFNESADPVPSYTKTKESNIRYAAGYYAFKFSNGWTQGFCPKLTTLTEYDFLGPYTTKLETQNAISQKNREIKDL